MLCFILPNFCAEFHQYVSALHNLKSPVSAAISLLYSVQSGLGGTLSEQDSPLP